MCHPTLSLDVVMAAATALMPFLVALAALAYKLVVGQLPAAKRAKVEGEVALIVSAVEQAYKAVPGSGAYKKAEVLRIARSLGLDISAARLDLLIEAAVASLPARGPDAPAPAAPPTAPDSPLRTAI